VPVEASDAFVQFTHHTKLPVFDYIASIPSWQRQFNIFMSATLGARNYWTEWFPIKGRLLDGARDDTKLLVDIAGGKGHDLQRFLSKFPNAQGLVLQDLPPALEMATADELDMSVERMVYDYYTEQPIKGSIPPLFHLARMALTDSDPIRCSSIFSPPHLP
jgi:hypothetical protein